MIHVIENPVSIDMRIQALQKGLYAYLKNTWSLTDLQYESYGRVYRNRSEKGYVPEVIKSGNEYKEVLFDNAIPVQSFFGIGTQSPITSRQYKQPVHVVFFCNLDVIKPNLGRRGDLEVRRDVYEYLIRSLFGFVPQSEKIGVQSSLAEYSGKGIESVMVSADMHPWHTFRFDLTCTYDPTTII